MTVATALAAAGELVPALQQLPLALHLVAAAAFLTGLALWALGRRLVRPLFALNGCVLGAAAGALLLPLAGLPESSVIATPLIGLALGAVLGLILAVALFRVAMSISAGLVLALFGALVASTSLHFLPETIDSNDPQPAPPLELSDQGLPGVPWAGDDAQPRPQPDAPDEAQPDDDTGMTAEQIARSAADRARRFVHHLAQELIPVWQGLSGSARAIIALGALSGLALGVIGGLVAPKRSAAAVTAMFGAAVWLPSLTWLAHYLDLPGRRALHFGPTGWLVLWLAVSMIGTAIQLIGLRRSRRRSPP